MRVYGVWRRYPVAVLHFLLHRLAQQTLELAAVILSSALVSSDRSPSISFKSFWICSSIS